MGEAKVASGSKVFISEMEGKLDGFIAPEIVKQKLPLTVVLEEKDADFVLVGASIKADDKWYHIAFGGKDKNEGNVRLLDVNQKTMIWAGEAGDRSLWYGSLRRGGQRKVAGRIVSQMKKDLFFIRYNSPLLCCEGSFQPLLYWRHLPLHHRPAAPPVHTGLHPHSTTFKLRLSMVLALKPVVYPALGKRDSSR